MDADKLNAYLNEVAGPPAVENLVAISGWQAVERLWPLNDLFRPKFEVIKQLTYDKRLERAADKAIDAYIARPTPDVWAGLAPTLLRVLLERHNQFIVGCLINETAKKPIMSLPAGLSEDQQRAALMLYGLAKMKLPYPIENRAHQQLPASPHPAPELLQ